jgi:hypothetical protein
LAAFFIVCKRRATVTEARIGWGGRLYLSTDNTEANLVQLQEVRSVGFPQDTTDEQEVTHLLSPNRRKEYIQGLIDGGEFSATVNYDPGSATDLALTNAKELGTTRKCRIEVPDTTGTGSIDWNFTFSCFVKKYAPGNMEPNTPITAEARFRVTGDVDQGAGASGS